MIVLGMVDTGVIGTIGTPTRGLGPGGRLIVTGDGADVFGEMQSPYVQLGLEQGT